MELDLIEEINDLRKAIVRVDNLLSSFDDRNDINQYIRERAYHYLSTDEAFIPFRYELPESLVDKELVILRKAKAELAAKEIELRSIEEKEEREKKKKEEKEKYTELFENLRKGLVYPIITAVVIALIGSLISSYLSYQGYIEQQVFKSDYERATKLMDNLSVLQNKAYDLKWEIGEKESKDIFDALVENYLQKVASLNNEFTIVTQNIPFPKKSVENQYRALAALEIQRLINGLSSLRKNENKKQLEDKFYKLVDNYHNEGIITQEQAKNQKKRPISQKLKDDVRDYQSVAVVFDPSIFNRLSNQTNSFLFSRLESEVFKE